MPTNHLIIKGKVQGVFYRAGAGKAADQIGITGWIKNSEEGHVEATISGSDEQLMQFIQWCQHGPKNAEVETVIVTEKDETTFEKFIVIRQNS